MPGGTYSSATWRFPFLVHFIPLPPTKRNDTFCSFGEKRPLPNRKNACECCTGTRAKPRAHAPRPSHSLVAPTAKDIGNRWNQLKGGEPLGSQPRSDSVTPSFFAPIVNLKQMEASLKSESTCSIPAGSPIIPTGAIHIYILNRTIFTYLFFFLIMSFSALRWRLSWEDSTKTDIIHRKIATRDGSAPRSSKPSQLRVTSTGGERAKGLPHQHPPQGSP